MDRQPTTDTKNDNMSQVLEIQAYKEYLSELLGKEVERNVAARIWIRKNARIWRLKQLYTA